MRDKLRYHHCKGKALLELWERKGKPVAGARQPVDWSLYGGLPKNRPPLKVKTETKPMPVLKDEEEVEDV